MRTYLEAAQWFAADYLIPAGFTDWDGVRAKQVQEWTVTLLYLLRQGAYLQIVMKRLNVWSQILRRIDL